MILYIYSCMMCGEECQSRTLYPQRQRIFCSDECQDAWMAEHREWLAIWRRNTRKEAT